MATNNTATQATRPIEPNHVCDNFKPIVPTEEYMEHTIDRPFCGSVTCPCHKDHDAIAQVNEWYMDGLITMVDAYRIFQGQTV